MRDSASPVQGCPDAGRRVRRRKRRWPTFETQSRTISKLRGNLRANANCAKWKYGLSRGQNRRVPHLRAVKALERAGVHIARQGKHIVRTDDVRIVTIPRHDPVDA